MRTPDTIRVERSPDEVVVEVLRPPRFTGLVLSATLAVPAVGVTALALGSIELFVIVVVVGMVVFYAITIAGSSMLDRDEAVLSLGLRLSPRGLVIAERGAWTTAAQLPWRRIRDFRIHGRRVLLETVDGTTQAIPSRLGRAERGWLHDLLEQALAAGGLPEGHRLPPWMQHPPDPRVSVEVEPDTTTVELPGSSVVHVGVLAALVGAAVFLVPLLWIFEVLAWAWVVLAPLGLAVLVDAISRLVQARVLISARSLTWETRVSGRVVRRRSVPLEALAMERTERSLVLRGDRDLVWGRGQEPEVLDWLAQTAEAAARSREAALVEEGLGQEQARVPEAIRGLVER